MFFFFFLHWFDKERKKSEIKKNMKNGLKKKKQDHLNTIDIFSDLIGCMS